MSVAPVETGSVLCKVIFDQEQCQSSLEFSVLAFHFLESDQLERHCASKDLVLDVRQALGTKPLTSLKCKIL